MRYLILFILFSSNFANANERSKYIETCKRGNNTHSVCECMASAVESTVGFNGKGSNKADLAAKTDKCMKR